MNHYFIDDEPLQIGTTFIPWSIAGGTVLASKAKTGRGSIYERMAELGHTITRVREEIAARMPTPTETATLAIPPGVPVIELLHTGIDQNGQRSGPRRHDEDHPVRVQRLDDRENRSVLYVQAVRRALGAAVLIGRLAG